MAERKKGILDITGTYLFPEDGFEASDIPPNEEPRICLVLITGDVFSRALPNLEPPMIGKRRVEVALVLDQKTGALRHERFDPEIHGDDLPQIDLKRYEELIARAEAEGLEITRSLQTVRKGGASRGRPFNVDEAVRQAGGDIDAQVPKPKSSFRLS